MDGIKEEGCMTHGEGEHWNYSLQRCTICNAKIAEDYELRNTLYKFYDVDNVQDLIVEQMNHITRLQAKTPLPFCEPCNYRR